MADEVRLTMVMTESKNSYNLRASPTKAKKDAKKSFDSSKSPIRGLSFDKTTKEGASGLGLKRNFEELQRVMDDSDNEIDRKTNKRQKRAIEDRSPPRGNPSSALAGLSS